MESARGGRIARLAELYAAVRWVIRELRAGRSVAPGSNAGNSLILAFRAVGQKES